MNWKSKVAYLAKFIGLFIYFSVGLFLIVAAAGAAAGGLITGDSWGGVLVLFAGAMLLVGGGLGKIMLTKIKVSFEDLRIVFKKAAETVEEESQKKNK